MKYFSIVIPLYNKDYALRSTLESVYKQKYKLWELIIIDDGSTDESINVLKDFMNEKRLENLDIKFFQQKNQGVSAARNYGINCSKYNYVCLLDADDEWHENFLLDIRKLIDDYPNAAMYSLQHETCINNKLKFNNKSLYKKNYRGYVKNFFIASIFGSVVNSSKVCINKNNFKAVGGFPVGYKAGEDLFVWMELALRHKVVFENKVSVTINVIDDFSRRGRNISIPYPFIYYSENLDSLNYSAKLYILKIYLAHFFESIREKNWEAAKIRCFSGKDIFPVIYHILLLSLSVFKRLF